MTRVPRCKESTHFRTQVIFSKRKAQTQLRLSFTLINKTNTKKHIQKKKRRDEPLSRGGEGREGLFVCFFFLKITLFCRGERTGHQSSPTKYKREAIENCDCQRGGGEGGGGGGGVIRGIMTQPKSPDPTLRPVPNLVSLGVDITCVLQL